MILRDAISLEGRAALVTGGAGAIGSATARLLAARGARVAVADIDFARAERIAHEIGTEAVPIEVDLEDEASTVAMVNRAVAHFGRLDILHNNATLTDSSIHADLDVETMDTRLWDRNFAVNVRAVMIACRQALPHLARNGTGSIINTVSIIGARGAAYKTAYAASKAAAIQLTRSIAASHGRKGVRCNAVAPGLILHPAVVDTLPAEFIRGTTRETPRGRLGVPEDIAELVAFLASDSARHLTGQLIMADGGLTSHLPGSGDLEGDADAPGSTS